MKINNVELQDFDVFDADELEKCEDAIENFKSNVKEMKDFEKVSEYMRYNCNVVFDLFNDIFGEGTDKKIFGTKTNIIICLKAVDELLTFVNDNKSKQEKEINKMLSKYSKNK